MQKVGLKYVRVASILYDRVISLGNSYEYAEGRDRAVNPLREVFVTEGSGDSEQAMAEGLSLQATYPRRTSTSQLIMSPCQSGLLILPQSETNDIADLPSNGGSCTLGRVAKSRLLGSWKSPVTYEQRTSSDYPVCSLMNIKTITEVGRPCFQGVRIANESLGVCTMAGGVAGARCH